MKSQEIHLEEIKKYNLVRFFNLNNFDIHEVKLTVSLPPNRNKEGHFFHLHRGD
jgi:hypothetical protein